VYVYRKLIGIHKVACADLLGLVLCHPLIRSPGFILDIKAVTCNGAPPMAAQIGCTTGQASATFVPTLARLRFVSTQLTWPVALVQSRLPAPARAELFARQLWLSFLRFLALYTDHSVDRGVRPASMLHMK